MAWYIGPEVTVAWQGACPALPTFDVLSASGLLNHQRLADKCVTAAALEGEGGSAFKTRFFATDPTGRPDGAATGREETPPPLPADMPVFIAQGTADRIVLPWPNAMLQEQWCDSGSTLTWQQFQSPDVEPLYVLFEDFTHVKFYWRSFFNVVEDEEGRFQGFVHVDDWVPQRLVTATGPNPLPH